MKANEVSSHMKWGTESRRIHDNICIFSKMAAKIDVETSKLLYIC